jgi:hypothetical protein
VDALPLFRSTFASPLVVAANEISAATRQTNSEDRSMGGPPQEMGLSNQRRVPALILINEAKKLLTFEHEQCLRSHGEPPILIARPFECSPRHEAS